MSMACKRRLLYLSKRVMRRLAGWPATISVSAPDTMHLDAAVAAGAHTPSYVDAP